jgi:antitoxin component YwqK of YwqJK toxin-antitoxin module
MKRLLLILSALPIIAMSGDYEDAKLAYKIGNYQLATTLYQKAADMGDAKAQYALGLMYENGKGVQQDNEKAAELYQKASDQGHLKATMHLGFMYSMGKGVHRDHKKALELFKTTHNLGENSKNKILKKASDEQKNAIKKIDQNTSLKQTKSSNETQNEYDQSSRVVKEMFFENGVLNGIRKLYYNSGNIKTETPYKKGRPNGISKEYYETGELKTEKLFKNGKIDGISKSYYKNGKIKAEVPYSNGDINGHIRWYFETGELERDMSYKNGLKDGFDKEHYKTGALQFLTPYKRGKQEGVKKWYYITGELRSEILMKDGKAASLLKNYDKNGNLMYEGKGNVPAEDLNLPTVKGLTKDYPVTEEKCQIEDESVLKVMFAHYLKRTTPSFPEEGVVKFDYNTTSKYGHQPEFKVRIIHFVFKDSETCNRFLDEFDAKTDHTAYNECKAKAYAEYQTIRDKCEDHQSPVVQKAYNIYLTKIKQCEWLIKYPD